MHINTSVSSRRAPRGQKHQRQSRKHARSKKGGGGEKKKLNGDGNRLQKLFISLLFYVFLVLTVHPSLSPVPLFHSLFPSSTFLSMLHIFYPHPTPTLSPPPQPLTPFLHYISTLLSPFSFSLAPLPLSFSFLPFPPSSHYLTLWLDAQ